jgi:hypothetical protein
VVTLIGDLSPLSRVGRKQELASWASEALEQLESRDGPDDGHLRSTCRLAMAEVAMFVGDFDRSHGLANTILESSPDPETEMAAHRTIVNALILEGGFDRIGPAATRLLELARSIGDDEGIAIAYGAMLSIDAIAAADRTGIPSVQSIARVMGTINFVFENRHAERVPHLLDAVGFARSAANRGHLAWALLGLGHAYALSDVHSTDAAVDCFREGLELMEKQRRPSVLWAGLESVANGLGCLHDSNSCMTLWAAIDANGMPTPDMMFRPFVSERFGPVDDADRQRAAERGHRLTVADAFDLAADALDQLRGHDQVASAILSVVTT